MPGTTAIIWWVRRDLRLDDNPALHHAAGQGGPVVPVFIHDEAVAVLGAAPRWRLGLGIAALGQALAARGSRLVLRRGPALETLRALLRETGARAVVWNRLYDPDAVARDRKVKADLQAAGIEARSFNGHLLHEPWEVATGQGGFYRVFTPFWRAVRDRAVPQPLAAPACLPAPAAWPGGDVAEGWRMDRGMARGAAVVARHVHVGAQAARARLDGFVAGKLAAYDQARDRMDAPAATSGLAENLSLGEISARSVWTAAARARADGNPGAETFLKELVWREFAYHLLWHTPHILTRSWRPEWETFPWRGDSDHAEAWRQGRTGVALVDAAMRQMYVTGIMHNRGRMIVASYLTKHLMTHWRVGHDWFADCLIDYDPAANAMGWQWAAGSGPDAAPYFRIFNPDTQAARFDPRGAYRRRFVAELSDDPGPDARAFFDAAPRRWGLTPGMGYPERPIVGLKEGREAALAAYKAARA